MKKQLVLSAVAAFGVLTVLLSLSVRQAGAQVVFQAAGPTAESIQGTVDAFRAALGNPNNGNGPGQTTGRREINWDGGGSTATTAPVTPFDVFLNTRGTRFTTPGTGLSQAPPSGGPQGGLVVLFDNPTYATTFSTFSAPRLFTPVGSRITEGLFFVPGTNGAISAMVSGFGAVFTDVDEPNGENVEKREKEKRDKEKRDKDKRDKRGEREEREDEEKPSALIEYFDAYGHRLFTGVVPASPGDGSLSFFGIVFDDPRIARVRITSGNVAPGPDDDRKHDVVMMDDFIYGEPQPIR